MANASPFDPDDEKQTDYFFEREPVILPGGLLLPPPKEWLERIDAETEMSSNDNYCEGGATDG